MKSRDIQKEMSLRQESRTLINDLVNKRDNVGLTPLESRALKISKEWLESDYVR